MKITDYISTLLIRNFFHLLKEPPEYRLYTKETMTHKVLLLFDVDQKYRLISFYQFITSKNFSDLRTL